MKTSWWNFLVHEIKYYALIETKILLEKLCPAGGILAS